MVLIPKVLNCRTHEVGRGERVYVGRPSKWGNPFRMGVDGTREEVIEKYREWLLGNERLMRDLEELRGKDLACWCAPKPCHADVLLELVANRPEGE